MLRIERRTAKFPGNLSTRTEKHGDDDVLGCDVPNITMQIPRGRDLAVTLIGEGADALLWKDNGHGVTEPRFTALNPYALAEKIEAAKVSVWARGLDESALVFPSANLKSVKLKPLPGGVLQLVFTLQVNPEGEDEFGALADCLNHDCEVEIDCKEFGAQAKLPLSDAA